MKVVMRSTIVLLFLLLYSCQGQHEREALQAQADSLATINSARADSLAYYSSIMTEISEGLDSITAMESIIFNNDKGIESRVLTHNEVKEKLTALANLLERQNKRIAELEDSLALKGDSYASMKNVIAHLNQQIDEKNRTIAALRKELEQSNHNIRNLHQRIGSLTESNNLLEAAVKEQEEALTVQSNLINEGYVKIGTKKELQQMGLLTKGGLFSKSKLNVANIDPAQFMSVDIRTFMELEIPSKKVKVLSQMPSSSYTLTSSGGSTHLSITDPATFWSVSNFLIIQTN